MGTEGASAISCVIIISLWIIMWFFAKAGLLTDLAHWIVFGVGTLVVLGLFDDGTESG